MAIKTNARHIEAEGDGHVELTLSAVTYTGERSVFGPNNIRSEGGYPALDSFRQGETKLVLLPSSRLGWWENHTHFDIAYDPETIASALLERNYIPEQIVGPGYDPDIRQRVIDRLSLEPFTGADDLRGQLSDIAGVEAAEAAEETVDSTRTERLVETYDRSVLIKVASTYDGVDALLEDSGVSNPAHLKSTALASFLADQDDAEVDRRLATAEQGGDIAA